jgi:hypothetical protein
MKPTSLPPFVEGINYRQLHPTKEGGRRWRYLVTRRVFLPITGIVTDDNIISFYDSGGTERGYLSSIGITIHPGYAWNGCSPKRWVPIFGWVGTIDFKSTILASAFHDLLYQFRHTKDYPLNQRTVDLLFYHTIAMSGSPAIAELYHMAVASSGAWGKHCDNSGYSKINSPIKNAI